MNVLNTWVGTVIEDGDDLALVFPAEMLEALGWEEGDNIVWDVSEDGKALIARKEKPDVDNTSA